MVSNQRAQQLTQVIQQAVRSHERVGLVQWYVDEFTIDCDAEEFWQVVEQAITEAAGVVIREGNGVFSFPSSGQSEMADGTWTWDARVPEGQRIPWGAPGHPDALR